MTRNFQARRQVRRTIYSVPALIVLLVVTLLLARGVWSAYTKYARTEELLAQAKSMHVKLLERTGELEKETTSLSTDRGIEKEVRAHFQVARPGEEVVILVDEATTTVATTSPKKAWWHFW